MCTEKKQPTSEETAAFFAKRRNRIKKDRAEKALDGISKARVALAWEKCREYEGWMRAYDSLILEPPDPDEKADQRSSFREIAETRQRETLSAEAEANTAAFEKKGIMPAWAWSDVKAARSIMRALLNLDYSAPEDPDQLGKHLFVLCVVLADLYSAKIPVSRVDSETLQFNLSKLLWAAGFGMATYSNLVPRMITSDNKQKAPRNILQQRREQVLKLAKDFKGHSLARYAYDNLRGTVHEASMETFRRDIKELKAEGKIPNR